MKYVFLILATWLSIITYGQDSCELSITGQVVDEHDGSELSYANVLLSGTDRGASADQAGRFRLDKVCAGPVLLVAGHVGCTNDTIVFNVQSDTHVVINLEHHVDLLEVVEIESKKPHETIASRSLIDNESIASSSSKNIAELLSRVEGVQVLSTGGNIAKPMIHGMTGNRVAIVDDGVTIEGQQWGSEHAPEVDQFSMEEAEVVFGASTLRYGPQALAGAVVTHPKTDSSSTWGGWFQTTAQSNGRGGAVSGLMRGPLLKKGVPLFLTAQGTASRMGDLSAPAYFLENTGSFDRHFRAKLSWLKPTYGISASYRQFNTDLGVMSYAHIGNLSDLEEVLERGQPINPSQTFSYQINRPNQHVEHEIASTDLWWKPQLETKVMLRVSRQYNLRQEFDITSFSNERPDLQYELTTYSADLEVDHRWSAKQKSEVGVVTQRLGNSISGRFFIPNYLRYELGAFAVHHLQFERVEIEGGLRYDNQWQTAYMYREDTLYSPHKRFNGLSWNVGMSWSFKWFDWSSNVAQGWRPPAINELYSSGLHHGAAAIEFGDENLRGERSWSWYNQLNSKEFQFLGFKWLMMARLHASYFEDYIYLVPTGNPELTIRGAFPSFRYTAVNAFLRGVDFSTEVTFNSIISAHISGAVLRANAVDDGKYLVFIPPDRASASMRFNLPFIRHTPFIELGATGVNKQHRVPTNEDFAAPPAAYALFHAEYQWSITTSQDHDIVIALKCDNLLNTPYRSYLNRLRYYAQEPGRVFSFSVRIPINLKSSNN